MDKPHLDAIEYIRGISMLGVIGIHIGSQYLANPTPNIHLVALFEIVTRFSVPIFFFISAFGLFYHLDPGVPFSYRNFLRRRLRAVLIPYLVWSAFYILHYTLLFRDPMLLNLRAILKYLFFGFASYQLYFLVILLWFYLFMPVWIWMVRRMTRRGLFFLLLFQIAFDYWSSFLLQPYAIANPYIQVLLVNRLNYWVVHYIFIFVLGGWLGLRFEAFRRFMRRRRPWIVLFFVASLAGLTGYYYWLLYVDHYPPVGAINMAHQLCPAGILYTLGASLFFFTEFTLQRYPHWLNALFSLLGRHSYFAYLVHPVIITYISLFITRAQLVMTAPLALLFYGAVAAFSVAAAIIVRRIGKRCPIVNELTIGSKG